MDFLSYMLKVGRKPKMQAKGGAESRITMETTDGANSCVNEKLREEKKGSLNSVIEAAWSTDDHL